MRVCIAPFYKGEDRADGGIRRVVEAQAAYLPRYGWDVTDSPDEADLIACHGATLAERPGVPLVNHNHGLMWDDYTFGPWGDDVNAHVVEAMVRAEAVTAPSRWVAHAISRGMLVAPEVVYHGVDPDAWAHTQPHLGYVLWNKARADAVSDPQDMQDLAGHLPDVPFLSTFGRPAGNVHIIGAMPYDDMKQAIQRAGVYLATARETFGVGTLEALASGVPVAGWRYGGQAEIVVDGETGYLAEWGDYEGLAQAVRRCLAERERLSRNAVADVARRWRWEDKILHYAMLYDKVVKAWRTPKPKVSVVITCHNLARYLPAALDSVLGQTMRDFECIIVDDKSTDDTHQVAHRFITDRKREQDARFDLRTPERNLKLSGARNFGAAHAKGQYLLFLDADDMLAPNALDVLSQALDTYSDIHIAYGHLDIVNDQGEERRRNPWPASAFDWHAQIAHLNQLHYSAMMRRAVWERSGGYRVRDWRAEDASFWSRATSFGFRAAKVTEETTLIYRLRSDSKSRGEDSDGDWTAWFPWRLAGDPHSGLAAMRSRLKPSPSIVPFGAQGRPAPPRGFWPVHHRQHPLISVIIPVGPGHERHLIDALDSLQAQTLPDWECIVVNDTGADLGYVHPWAYVTRTAGGQGAGHARNRGLERASAPLVLFLDADDLLHPQALEAMARAHAETGGQYVYSDWATLDDATRWDSATTPRTVDEYDARAMLQGLRHAVTALVPTVWVRAVGGFDETLPVFEDWDLYCKLAIAGYCGVRVRQPLLIYRHQAGLRTRTALKPRAQGEDHIPAYTPLGETVAAALADRYAAYRTGEEPIMGCCGGNRPSAEAAGDALNMLLGTIGVPVEAQAAAAPSGPGVVRMEFIGEQQGAMTFYGKASGRAYRAGREMSARYHDVLAGDVEHFVNIGLFRVVPAETLAQAAATDDQPPVFAGVEAARPEGRTRQRSKSR